MSLKTLELAKCHLSIASEKLEVSINSTVDIRLPSNRISSRDDDDSIKALTSGNIWVSRGNRCRVDIQAFFKGKSLNKRIAILEPLGYHVRNAPLWSQLSLSTSLEIPQSDELAESQTDISIYINHDASISNYKAQPRDWPLDDVDIKPPDSVLCANFERLRIILSFDVIKEIVRPISKRTKPSLHEPNTAPLMLLHSHGPEEVIHLSSLETVVSELSEGLSPSIAKCFDTFNTFNNYSSAHSADSDEMLLLSDDRLINSEDDAASGEVVAMIHSRGVENSGNVYAKEAKERLNGWLDLHSANPYPTNEEKFVLMKQTGLRISQLDSWFKIARRRKVLLMEDEGDMKGPLEVETSDGSLTQSLEEDVEDDILLIQPEEEMLFDSMFDDPEEDDMLLIQPEEEMLFDNLFDDPEEDDMLLIQPEEEMLFDNMFDDPEEDDILLSQTLSIVPSLPSQPSSHTVFTISSTDSLKRPFPDEPTKSEPIDSNFTSIPPSLPITSANKLTNVALQLLVAGPSLWKKDLQDITVRKPLPTTSLSVLAPSIFCPGFIQLMAHNSKFLPTITNAISGSWVRNVRGEALRGKLVRMADAKISVYHDGDEDGKDGSVERLSALVQGRIWRMMQGVCRDEGAVRKLWKTPEGADSGYGKLVEEECRDEDLLGENSRKDVKDIEMGKAFEDFVGEELIDDEEELIFDTFVDGGEDEDLLNYLEERERLAAEMETDEMLLGDGFCPEENDPWLCGQMEEAMLLLEDGNGNQEEEDMLL